MNPILPHTSLFFVFDVESVGLFGEGFAVAGGVFDVRGDAISEFAFHCPDDAACGTPSDRTWIRHHVTTSDQSIKLRTTKEVREAFWQVWVSAKNDGAIMFGECIFPVETNFLEACIRDLRSSGNGSYPRGTASPYPCHEIATLMAAARMDPMMTYDRLPNELPAHEPLADARLSARLLSIALQKLEMR